MLTVEEKLEAYYFLRYSRIDLDMAAIRLADAAKEADRKVRTLLIESGVVAYCRPFSGNKGMVRKLVDKTGNKVVRQGKEQPFIYRLNEVLPGCVADPQLHGKVIALRHQLFAHTDLSFQDAQVLPHEGRYLMRFRLADFDALSVELSAIMAMVRRTESAVIESVKQIHREPWFASHQFPAGFSLVVGHQLAGVPAGQTGLIPAVVDLGNDYFESPEAPS